MIMMSILAFRHVKFPALSTRAAQAVDAGVVIFAAARDDDDGMVAVHEPRRCVVS
jgi:hypothetical protein